MTEFKTQCLTYPCHGCPVEELISSKQIKTKKDLLELDKAVAEVNDNPGESTQLLIDTLEENQPDLSPEGIMAAVKTSLSCS